MALLLLSAYNDETESDPAENDLQESSLDEGEKNLFNQPVESSINNEKCLGSEFKRKLSTENDEMFNKKRKPEEKMPKKLLSVPLSVQDMFVEKKEPNIDSNFHDGKVRCFPHQRGNWASYVYVRYPEDLESFMRDCLEPCMELLDDSWKFCDDFHLSLSRTVSLAHHCIMPLKDSLTSRFCNIPTFSLKISGAEVYVNDEKTRSFIGIMVSPASEFYVKEAVSEVDNVFAEYRLPKYYEQPSFHLSFAWKCGDITEQKDFRGKMKNLRDFVAKIENEESYLFEFRVDKIFCKTGNKLFSVDLR